MAEIPRPEIVISGISGRFPSSDTMDEFKNNLFGGVDMVTADDSRWPVGFFNLPPKNGKIRTIEKFDNEFFDVPSDIANNVDPQERLLLELTYEAMIDAGLNPEALRGSNTGVYHGSCFVETHEDFDDPQRAPEMLRQSVTRIANTFELKGPILLVDTACGSSLSAFNEAFLAIKYGICDQAIVCGSNTLFRPRVSLQFKDLKMTSKDGICKCLDEGANGYVRSEAAIAMVLQKSTDSKRIYAKVLNSKSNSDGYKEEGITFPSRVSQARLCRETYAEAGLDTRDIKYIEAHVTGTAAGDPVEMGAVYDAICEDRDDPILVGCLKASIGHSEGASGLCGLSKACIVLQTQMIPPNLHFERPNPAIEGLLNHKMIPVTRTTPLPGSVIPVNCFGFGGANTHVVLKGYYDPSKINKIGLAGALPRLVTVCGRTAKSVKYICSKLESDNILRTNEFLSLLNDFSKGANEKMPFRGYSIISSTENGTKFETHEASLVQNMPVWLVFRCEASAFEDTSSLLALPAFKETLKSLQKPLNQFSINLDQIFETAAGKKKLDSTDNTIETYLKTVAAQIAFISILKDLNLKPTGTVGYSVGLLAKAYSDGHLVKEDAILAAYYAGLYKHDARKLEEAFQKVLMRSPNGTIHHLIQSLAVPAQGLNGTPKGSFVVDVGPNGLHERGQLPVHLECPLATTLKTLGDLYVNGSALALETLYPKVRYPLPSTTPSLSSLIKWDHSVTWPLKPYLFQNQVNDSYQTTKKIKFHFDKRTAEDYFLYDHKIDERPLFPATGYLMCVWNAFSRVASFTVLETPVEFRDVVFARATVMTDGETTLEVTISEDNGNFELKEGDTMIVKGNIRVDTAAVPILEPEPMAADVLTMERKDIYKEFRVRGYDYGQYFQGLYEAKANGRIAKVTWRDIISASIKETMNLELEAEIANLWMRSWIPFVDAMFQLDILKEENDSRSLFVPTRIESIRCDPAKLRASIEQADKYLDPLTMSTSSLITVRGRYDSLIWTDGIIVKGLKTSMLKRRQQYPRVLRYSHVPFNQNTYLSVDSQKRVSRYIEACTDAINGNIVEKDSFDLLEPRHSLLRSILLGSTDVSDLSQDMVLGAMVDPANFSPNSIYSLFELAITNLELTTEKVNYDMLEVNDTNVLAYGSFKFCYPDILVKDLINFNYSLLHPSPDSVDSSEKEGMKEVITWNTSGLQSLPLQNLIIFKADTMEKFASMMPRLRDSLKDQGFMIVIYKAKIENESVQDLVRMLNIKVASMPADKLKETAEKLGFIHVCDKSAFEKTVPVAMMIFRKQSKPILEVNTRMVEVGVLDYERWFEPLKALLAEPNELNDKRLWIVSKVDEAKGPRLVTGLVGFVKTLRLEENGSQIRCIIDTTAPKIDLKHPKYKKVLETDLLCSVYDERVGWGNYMAEDVERHDVAAFGNANFAYLRSLKPGDMSSLTWVQSDIGSKLGSQKKAGDKKLIDVYYSALNFRDIMFASGKLDSEAIPGIHPNVAQDSILGLEYTGIEVATNRRIMGITPYKGLATAVLVSKDEEDFIWPIPEKWSMEEAATVPVVYATAMYALVIRGKLVQGESVLIHSGCGGVGLAAINICMSIGCTVYTTCGSAEKRKYLADKFPRLVYPVNRIFNSRDITFESDILQLTEGRGVDVILNSLAEEKLQSSLNCLAGNGRFLEIGKVDFIQDNKLYAHQLSANQSFHGVLLDALFKYSENTYLPARLLEEKRLLKQLVVKGIEDGVVKPLDRTVFGKDQVEEAFRYMSTGKHIGKVVVKIREPKDERTGYKARALKMTYCHAEKSYIVLGGAGGFGLEVVQWLATRGAKTIFISSRRGLREPYQHYAVARLRSKGVKVIMSSHDVTCEAGVRQLLLEAEREAPVGGIYNAAVVYKDSLFMDQSVEQFKEVCGPKADATLYLDRLSRVLCPELEYFVTFSSLSCGRGNAGQTNYSYANSLMDSICVDRVANGFPALSIQWGVIGDVGIITETSASNDAVLLGTRAQRMHSCLDTIDRCAQDNSAVYVSFINAEEKSGSSSQDTGDILNVVTRLLGLKDMSNIDPSTNFGALGLDSLIAVEIKQILEKATGNPMSVKEIREFTIAQLMLLSKNQATSRGATATEAAAASAT